MNALHWLEKIRELQLGNIPKSIRIMNVCGGHERTLSTSGIRSILPENIELIPGPGCPVCVCPEESIKFAIRLSEQSNIILASFGDMLRVPANNGKKLTNTLLESRSKGNRVFAVASPLDVFSLASDNPKKTIIFFVAGFETTIAPLVSMLEQGLPDNIKLLVAARKTWPIVNQLLSSSSNNLDALIAPGHVASVMGSEEWRFITEKFSKPCAIAGFTDDSLLAAIYSVSRQVLENKYFLDNCYSSVVNNHGNRTARSLIEKYFLVSDTNWRGIGYVSQSGFLLKEQFNNLNAEFCFSDLFKDIQQKNKASNKEMPPGCDCDRVVLGQILPNECRLFGKACSPSLPVGPCMVSDEGACHIWWNNGSYKHKLMSSIQ